MRDNPTYTLMVEGHADERLREYNGFERRRANAVKDFLSSSESPFNI